MVGVQGSSDPNRELLDARALVGHLVPVGTMYAFLAEHRQRVFPDELFADLFPSGRGRPSVPADVIATVMLLQALGNLSDRDAVAALRTDLRWKVAAGLTLDDEGFHPTVLTLWRNKLRASQRPQRIFEAVREVIDATNVLSGKTRRALDSTVLDDAVTRQDAVMQLVAQIRRVRRLIPEAKALALVAHDYDNDPGKPVCSWNDRADIDRVVTELVGDAHTILAALDGVELDDVQAEAVGLLALVAGQDVEPGDGEGTWRIAPVTRPGRIVSVHDPDSRHVHKTNHNYRDGFKAHVGVEPDTGLITACGLTAGNIGDAQAGPYLLAGEAAPVEVLADSAYGSGEFRAHLAEQGHTATIKPIPLKPAVPDGFTIDDFTIDTTARTATCPNQVTTHISRTGCATFGAKCRSCPVRERCTTSATGGRSRSTSTTT
jgi:IS5 family transposase